MKIYTEEELKEILQLHKKWIYGDGGKRANLRGADLSDANLSDANLSDADMRHANLSDANLSDADMRHANLIGANLSDADMRHANLIGANLSYADMRHANLIGANLRGADLSDADLRGADLRYIVGEKYYIKSLQVEKYHISYTDTILNIGCQSHLITEWKEFSDEKISKMDNGALDWSRVWKPIIMNIIEASPAKKQEINK